MHRSLKLALALVVALAALLPRAAFAAPSLTLHANRVNFYSDSLSVLGVGNVSLRDTNGDSYKAQTIAVDLNRDRYLLVGDVVAVIHGQTVHATALNLERTEGHVYAIVVDDGVPRTIRIDRGDVANATVLVAPIGTFDFPNLFDRDPYIHGKVAQIVPHANIRMTPAIFTLQVAHVTIPWPSFLYTFASNPNFGASALSGANFDQPEGFFGSDRNLVSGHLRYTTGLGFGTAIDDHILWGDKAYVVAGVGPLLNPLQTYSVVAYQRMGSHLTQSLNFSALRHYYAQGTYTVSDGLPNILYTLTMSGFDGSATFGSSATLDLTASTYDAPLVLRYKYHVSADYGYAESTGYVYGLLPIPAEPAPYTAMWHRSGSLFVTSPLYVTPLDTRLLLTGTATRTWYAYPRHDDVITSNASLSKFINRFVNVIGTYSASWYYVTYTNGLQKPFFTPTSPVITADGTPYPGYFAYLGAQDFRQYELDTNWTPSAALSLRVSFIRSDNFLQYHGFGTPPYQANFNVQIRPAGTLTLNLGRAYYFNWGRQAWQPQFVFSLSP